MYPEIDEFWAARPQNDVRSRRIVEVVWHRTRTGEGSRCGAARKRSEVVLACTVIAEPPVRSNISLRATANRACRSRDWVRVVAASKDGSNNFSPNSLCESMEVVQPIIDNTFSGGHGVCLIQIQLTTAQVSHTVAGCRSQLGSGGALSSMGIRAFTHDTHTVAFPHPAGLS